MALSVPVWAAAFNTVRRTDTLSLAALKAMVTVANALYVAAGLPPFGQDPAVAALLRATRKAQITVTLRRNVVFDLLAFLRLCRERLSVPPPTASLKTLRDHAAACVILFTGWRPADVARLTWFQSLLASGPVLLMASAYSKGERLRAARGRAVGDNRPLGCTNHTLCAHCAVRTYARATRDVPRQPFPDLVGAVPAGVTLPCPLFLSHSSGQSRPVGKQIPAKPLRPLVQSLGVPGASVYTLRALISSAARFHGFSLDEVCNWCGWASPRTFLTHYHVVRTLPLPRSADPRWDAFPAVLAAAAWEAE